MKSKVLFQSQEHGCGVASIKMLLAEVYRNRSYYYIEEIEADDKAPSILELVQYASTHGMKLVPFKTDDLVNTFPTWNYPLLLLFHGQGNATHMVMAKQRKGKKVVIYDPASGKRAYTPDELSKRFCGIYLKVEGTKDVAMGNSTKFECNHKPPFPIAGALVSLFPSSFLCLGLFFLYLEVPLLVPFILFAFAFLSLLFARFLLAKSQEDFDARYINNLDADSKSGRRSRLSHYYAYKAASLSFAPFLATLSLNLSVAAIFLSAYHFTLGMGLLGCYVGLGLFLFLRHPRINKLKEESALLESDWIEEENAEKRKGILRCIRKNASRLSFLLFLEEGLVITLSLLVPLLITSIDGSLAVGELILYSLSFYFCLGNLTKIKQILDLYQRKRQEESYFRFHFMEKDAFLSPKRRKRLE